MSVPYIWISKEIKFFNTAESTSITFSKANRNFSDAVVSYQEEMVKDKMKSGKYVTRRKGWRAYLSVDLLYLKSADQSLILTLIGLINGADIKCTCSTDNIPLPLGSISLTSKVKFDRFGKIVYAGSKLHLEFIADDLIDNVPTVHESILPLNPKYHSEGIFMWSGIESSGVAGAPVSGYLNEVIDAGNLVQGDKTKQPLVQGSGVHEGADFIWSAERMLWCNEMAAFIGKTKPFTIIMAVGYNSGNHCRDTFLQFNDGSNGYLTLQASSNEGHLHVYAGLLSQGVNAQFCETTAYLPSAATKPIIIAIQYDGNNILKIMPGRGTIETVNPFNKLTTQATTMRVGRGFIWQGNDDLGDFRFHYLQICSAALDLTGQDFNDLLDFIEDNI